jgi:hypothetical protein
MVELNRKSVSFIFRLEILEHETVFVERSISPVHVFPFSTGNEPAKNIIELFPHKSSSIDKEVEESKEDSLD